MSKVYNSALQARVEQFLQDRQISQAKAAPLMGISQTALSQYRRSMYDNGDISALETERSVTMSKFYYTYGTDPRYPYQGGWTEIEALDRPGADKLFQMHHPDRTPGILNCADIYNEDEFRRTGMDEDNFGACCHEKITIKGRGLCC